MGKNDFVDSKSFGNHQQLIKAHISKSWGSNSLVTMWYENSRKGSYLSISLSIGVDFKTHTLISGNKIKPWVGDHKTLCAIWK